jgi:Zn finger protein HypA/HybF involved in hydrogenase expression
MGDVAALNRTLEQELFALLRGASLECLVCGEFVMRRGEAIFCPECGSQVVAGAAERRDREIGAGAG